MLRIVNITDPVVCVSKQTPWARWIPHPWARPHPTEECTPLSSARPPWDRPARSTLPSARWARPWTAWRRPSLSSARQWAPTPWARLGWATALALALRWGFRQKHKYFLQLQILAQKNTHLRLVDVWLPRLWAVKLILVHDVSSKVIRYFNRKLLPRQ